MSREAASAAEGADVSEPGTEAGRALIGDLMSSSKRMGPWEVNRAILAIEAEAAAESGRLREALAGLLAAAEHTHRMDRATAALDAAMADARLALETPPAPSDHGAPTRTEIIFAIQHVWQWIENHTTVAKPQVNGRKVNEFLDEILRYDRQRAARLATPSVSPKEGT